MSRSFHTDGSSDQSNKPFWDRGSGSEHANAQFSKYFKDLKNNEAYRNVDPLLVHALSKEAYLSGREDASKFLTWVGCKLYSRDPRKSEFPKFCPGRLIRYPK